MNKIKDVAASVHGRLLDRARKEGRPFQELLEHFGMERFLFRLSRSPYADSFVLKGALMLRVWDAPAARPTRDIDLVGRVDNSLDNLASIVRKLCQVQVDDDGVEFDAKSVVPSRIKEDTDFQGVRVTFEASLGKARFPMQIDVGFGDRLVPPPTDVTYPTLLDFPAPLIKGYAKETTIAEKFEAMVTLGTMNSRMKDFFDLWHLARRFDFDGATLREAVAATFANRGASINAAPVAWTPAFTEEPATISRWSAFVRRSRLDAAPGRLADVVPVIASFLRPVAISCRDSESFNALWTAGGPWAPRR